MRRRKSRTLLTPVESEMMHALWQHGPGTVHDVVDRLDRPLAYTSVLTMLRILERKGFLKRDPNPDGGRSHLYAPTRPQEAVQRSHVEALVERFFEGRAANLVTGLLDAEEKLSRRDLERIRALVDKRLGRAGGRGSP
jgi:predicted transcriptional regulator